MISGEPWMMPEDIPYQEKAGRLDQYNEIWGYQMIRAVDTYGGVYRADKEEAVSNLNSRCIRFCWGKNSSACRATMNHSWAPPWNPG